MKHIILRIGAVLALALALVPPAFARQEVVIGIGTQNTTTNTVTGGVVLKEMKLIEKYLPTTGKYKDIDFKLDWQNFTSGPPITNGMMARKLHIGMMGDYPLLVNGATGQSQPGNETQLVAIIAYNAFGSGNGVVVHKDSPYYELADLKGKLVSVPFGSAAHGMVLQAMQARGWKDDYWNLVSQSPEVGTTNLQEKKIEAHADFVPFADLLPYRGFARKIFDGAETKVPTFHGVVVRKDFAAEYPEVVVAYIKALVEANNWVRSNPAAAGAKIEEWTRIEKEVAYLYLGPGGIHTLDPTIKPRWLDTIKTGHEVLTRLNRVKPLDINAWVNETYVRQAYKELKLDYEAQKQTLSNYDVSGTDALCKTPITRPKEAGEVWIEGAPIAAYSSTACTLAAINKAQGENRKVRVAYLNDRTLGIKLFADKAFYAVNTGDPRKPQIVPFLLKKDAQAEAASSGGKLATYTEALAAAGL
ncbi:ABC transporter substrate-binding protein [Variovorax paradoxus]|jgi:NitT/TauT family transport system substrate-binding protein|uniref:ABC transporter substrate-binding protein n=1 Tax=Variovorax paradoxus TaxID=34073 RepID=UPI0029C85342|nr:ABC transporter substrate-binding protein [Variovorax paradoxus]WPH23817.1 ABC transporter substrate-binding protein [Variovorax paradoxus]